MFMRIEKAVIEQADIIGQVHSEAWKQAYVGVFKESFLREDTIEKRIRLWVLEANTKAIRFYEKNCFRFSGNTRVINRGQSYKQLQYEFVQNI